MNSKYEYPTSLSEYMKYYTHKGFAWNMGTWDQYQILLDGITRYKMTHEFNILVCSFEHPPSVKWLFQQDDSYWINLFKSHFPADEVEKRAWRMEKFIVKLKIEEMEKDRHLGHRY